MLSNSQIKEKLRITRKSASFARYLGISYQGLSARLKSDKPKDNLFGMYVEYLLNAEEILKYYDVKKYGKSLSQKVNEDLNNVDFIDEMSKNDNHLRLMTVNDDIVIMKKYQLKCSCRCRYFNIHTYNCSKYKVKLTNYLRCGKCLEEFNNLK